MDQSQNHDPIVIVKSDIKRPSFFKRIRAPFSGFSSPNKKIASAILSVLLIFGIGIGVYVAQKPTQLRPQAAVAGGIDITLDPSTIQTNQNQNFTVNVSVNAKTHIVTGVEFSVEYDPSKVQFVSGATGSFLPNLLGSTGADGGFHQSTGKVKFTKFTDPENNTQGTGTGTAAILTFKALQNTGSAQIKLNEQETQAAVSSQDSNWIENLGPTTVNFGTQSGFNPDPGGTLKDGLISYWNMNEATGSAVQDIVGTNHGTAVGTGIVADGKNGNGRSFSWGTSNRINIPDNASLSPQSMTVSSWVKPNQNNAGSYASIFNRRNASNQGGLSLEYNGNVGPIQCIVWAPGGTTDRASSTVNITIGQWNHVACTYDGANIKLYINGQSAGTGVRTGAIQNPANQQTVIGTNIFHGAGMNVNGLLDEIGYWNRALTATEIGSLYNGGSGNAYTVQSVISSPSPSPSISTSPTSLRISAPDESQNVGTQFTVTLKARSDSEKSNLFVSRIHFPPEKLEVMQIDEPESKIEGSNIVESFFDNTTGDISFVVGIPNGYQTQGERELAVITFKAKSGGNANIDLTAESQIFSNTTNTNILQNAYGDMVTLTGGTSSPSPAVCSSPPACPSGTVLIHGDPPNGCPVYSCQSVSPSPSASTNCATLKGDGNSDCRVTLQDLSVLLSNFSAINPVPSGKEKLDFNDDGRINTFDFSAMGNKLFQLGIIRRRG